MQNVPDAPAQAVPIKLDAVSLVLHSSGPVFVVVWALVFAALLVWIIAILKVLQISRLTVAEEHFEREAAKAQDAVQLFNLARRHEGAPGSRVVLSLAKRAGGDKLLEAVARRAVVAEQQRAMSFMATLSSIASASPFVGLFGTVYGIMDAFLRIGQQKSASLPVVAPAIGEALIATAIGLFAAIPAVIAFNALNKKIDDLLTGLEASSQGWVAVALADAEPEPPVSLRSPSNRPPGGAGTMAQRFPG